MSDMDDLRNLTLDDEYPVEGDLQFELGPELNQQQRVANQKFLGMTAAQRAFLALMLFLNVLVIGLGLLIVTGRLAL